MFLLDDDLVLSAHDLRVAAGCEFAVVAALDELWGWAPPVEDPAAGMLARVAELGLIHEQEHLRRLADEHPGGVRSLGRAEHSRAGYDAAMAQTLAMIGSDAAVLAQATLFDGSFVGVADFLQRTPRGWLISDAKLARSDSVPALLQIGAYAALLHDAGVPLAPTAALLLGSGEVSEHRVDELVAVARARRARLETVACAHGGDGVAREWGDPRWSACGRCAACTQAAEATRDVLLVAGLRASTRRRLREAGVRTVEELAVFTGEVPDVAAETLERLRRQAALQAAQDADPEGAVRFEVVDAEALHRLPAPSRGDLFFDFEGDPLWRERGSRTWGLEYLFGWVAVDTGEPVFGCLLAHDRAAEKAALEQFVAFVRARREQWPDLHIYHYADYEVSALTRLAVRHGTCEDVIDDFLRAGLFVDLYATVRASIRVSQRSYSIKKLEPLYMPARTGDVTGGEDSIVEYHRFMAARDLADVSGAAALLAGITHYNEQDCVSTWLLRNWLVEIGGGICVQAPAAAAEEVPASRQAALALEASVRALAAEGEERAALDLVAASVLFHAREDKPHWWRHFARLAQPVSSWRSDKGVLRTVGAPVLVEPWHLPPRARVARRRYEVLTEALDGSPPAVGPCQGVYAVPSGVGEPGSERDACVISPAGCRIDAVVEELSGSGLTRWRVTVEDNAPGGEQIDEFPVAFVPPGPPRTTSLDAALADVADGVRTAYPLWPHSAGLDVLRRRPPRMGDGGGLPAVGRGAGRYVEAVTQALLGMDDSYVAVQGPPGTGKTYVGARVIATLAARGWRIGVTSQAHAAIEHMLSAVAAAGLPGRQVGKSLGSGRGVGGSGRDVAWTVLSKADELARFVSERRASGEGFVIGGTAWDLTNRRRVAADSLDLVVVDEAGQFSLAKTLAVATAGRRLLLLGDPAQLPQVSQGSHPAPIDDSALGWLAGEAAVLSSAHGYFLADTWRMHPELTSVVSVLSYDGQLTAVADRTGARVLDGVAPGLHVHRVDHRDNRSSSVEEAAHVVSLVADLVGRTWVGSGEVGSGEVGSGEVGSGEEPVGGGQAAHGGGWTDPAGGLPESAGGRPLTADDLLVVTPYNAQVGTLKAALRAAGWGRVRVGTADRFQGQEAVVALVSLAASAPSEVSRGVGFLLDRHRLNVAISRAQYAAFVVHSRVLTDFAARSPAELSAQGAFLALSARAVSTVDVP